MSFADRYAGKRKQTAVALPDRNGSVPLEPLLALNRAHYPRVEGGPCLSLRAMLRVSSMPEWLATAIRREKALYERPSCGICGLALDASPDETTISTPSLAGRHGMSTALFEVGPLTWVHAMLPKGP